MKTKSTEELIEKYKSLVHFHSTADSFDPTNTKERNKAAKKIIKIAEIIDSRRENEKFYQLLNNENLHVRSWAAFNSIERMNSQQDIIKKSISIIKELANSNNLDSVGAQMWLENWKKTAHNTKPNS